MGRKVFPRIRNFVAIPVEGEVREFLLEKVKRWRKIQPSLKWEKKGNFHITLKFIGDSTEKEIKKIDSIIKEVFSSIPHFSAPLTGIGAFPDMTRARVIWLGAIFPKEFLNNIGYFDKLLFEEVGIPREKKAFTPHITLARVKNSKVSAELLQEFTMIESTLPQMNLPIKKIIHFKSELHPSGAIHTPIYTLDLK